jgi:CheY-like chemotaxis protein
VTGDNWVGRDAARSRPRNLGVVRLLVVDDDVSIGKLLRAIFDRDGWEVVNATSGEECLTMVRDAPPDVIVLDNMMPGLTGLETARQLRREGYDKPIVLFSAYDGPDLQSAAQELDLKPVQKIDTQAVIRIVDSLGGALT